jgi:hypothetical protein
MPTMSYIFITEPYISSYADIDVLLAIWRSGALHYYNNIVNLVAHKLVNLIPIRLL